MQLRTFSGSFSHGVVSANLKCLAKVWICRRRQFSAPSFQMAIVPCSIDFVGSGMIFFSSISRRTPRPEHFGQAPYGELKEKRRGVISPMEIPQSGHEYVWERSSSLVSEYRIFTRPFDTRVAVSSESASRCAIPSFTTSRSMTTSMLCFFCLSSVGGSDSSIISPSTIARVKPSFTICTICLRYSPFLPRMYGARIVNFVPVESARRRSTIC